MPDDFATWDAAYVLGALSPEDRHAFEAHMRGCAECTRAVRELAGLPGLLARTDHTEPDEPDEPDEPPADLLPRLLESVQRERRKRRLFTGAGWLAAAACAAGLVLVLILGSRSTTPAPNINQAVPMVAVVDTPVTATVSVTGVSWGTKIELKCTYPEDYNETEPYQLYVVNRAGEDQLIGSWKVLPGKVATMNASTALVDADIGAVQVRDEEGTLLVLDR